MPLAASMARMSESVCIRASIRAYRHADGSRARTVVARHRYTASRMVDWLLLAIHAVAAALLVRTVIRSVAPALASPAMSHGSARGLMTDLWRYRSR